MARLRGYHEKAPFARFFGDGSGLAGGCRHGATSVGEFRDEGYLPDAMVNFLALLGWNEGDGSQREMYSMADLTEAFSLNRITKSGAVFDKTKLSWMNGALIYPRCIAATIFG